MCVLMERNVGLYVWYYGINYKSFDNDFGYIDTVNKSYVGKTATDRLTDSVEQTSELLP